MTRKELIIMELSEKSLPLDMCKAAQYGSLYDECIAAGVTLEDCSPKPEPVNQDQYVVVVIRERNVDNIIKVESFEAGVSTANALLNAILKGHKGYEEDEFNDWERATTGCPTAWCNYGENWDAHVFKI